MGKKIKAYKFSLLMSVICMLLTAANYLAFKIPLVGISFIIVTISFIITFTCYKVELKNRDK